MYARRGGWHYARDEIMLQRHLVCCVVKGWAAGTLHAFMRGAVFLMPPLLRRSIYRKALRHREGAAQ